MIKPYYEEENITIYNGDCLEVMKELEPVNLCLTDIPFNVNWKYGVYNDNLTLEEYAENCLKWFTTISETCKRAVIKIPNKFSYLVLPIFEKALGYLWTVIQYSPNTTSHGAFNLNLYTQYLISKGEGKTPKTDFFINTKNNIETNHPAEMPTMPIKKLLNMFTDENDTILDPFLGSGTTARACKDLGRKCIGIEISKEYCDIAVRRLGQEVLF